MEITISINNILHYFMDYYDNERITYFMNYLRKENP